MKRYFIVSLFILSVLLMPQVSKAATLESLLQQVISLQQQLIQLLRNKQTPISGGVVVPTNENSEKQTVKLFFILSEGDARLGKIVACGSSAVAVDKQIDKTTMPLTKSLEALLSEKREIIEGTELYNFLADSDLRVDKVTIQSGVAHIYLLGKLIENGSCGGAAAIAQITETATQFRTVSSIKLYVNGKPYVGDSAGSESVKIVDKFGLWKVSYPQGLAGELSDLGLALRQDPIFEIRSGSENSYFKRRVNGQDIRYFFEDFYHFCVNDSSLAPEGVGSGPDQIHVKKLSIDGKVFCQVSLADSGMGKTAKTYEYISSAKIGDHTTYLGINFSLQGLMGISPTAWAKAINLIEEQVIFSLDTNK